MTSIVVMAPSAHHPIRPHSSCEVRGAATALPNHANANGDTEFFLKDFGLRSISTDFELDTTSISISTSSVMDGRGSVTQQQGPPTPPAAAVEPPPSTPGSKLPKLNVTTTRGKRSSLIERPRSWLVPSSKAARDAVTSLQEKFATSKDVVTSQCPSSMPSTDPERGLSGPESFAHFARRSWMSRSSRSPSPKNMPESATERGLTGRNSLSRAASKMKTSKAPHRLQTMTTNDEDGGTRQATFLKPASKPITLATSYLSRMKPKQHGSLLGRDGPDSDHSCASSATSLHRTSDSVRTSASRSVCSEGNTNTPGTDESCNETPPRLRDPLWSGFKSLDVEVKTFTSAKQTAARMAQVYSVLLPFLKETRNHPSHKTIGPEDVERRAKVLNKWWNAVLDMLRGPLPRPIAGMDRPVVLEAATMLMMRPEWRRSTSYLQPLAERSPLERVRSRSSKNASKSTMDSVAHAEMLAESAEHNVRTMFVANLVKQMAYVVDKMCLRHAPLSLVNFSGKTCAYAFFFAPGVADVLVRLWGLTPELIRRTAIELGLPRRDGGESDDITALFPPTLGALGWSSPRAAWDSLKQVPKMPLLVARIPWTGPWVTRWKGRDTDLFFIFCKYFHVLSDQFVTPGLPLTEKARSPAFALVHAQLLSLVDSTIHRQTSLGFDRSLAGPLIDAVKRLEATALALALPPTNLAKSMGENRLVILLKDFFLDDAAASSGARHSFAETFAALVKAAARKTSLYNHAACFALCDFLEEVLMIYHDSETAAAAAAGTTAANTTTYVDWPFWIDVCKKMASSMNTMTEVRLLSFIFTIWDAIARDSGRKANVCLEWLLTEESFNTFFNNWCPMVRAYYQRLVCWRMCRYTGEADDTDIRIYLTAAARLRRNWAHHLYLKQEAEENGRTPPSAAPMSPAMGKKFMIIRQEANPGQKALFMGFDTFARTVGNQGVPGNELPGASGGALGRPDTKKRWSLIGRVLSMTSANGAPSLPVDDLASRRLSDPTGLRHELAESAPLLPMPVSGPVSGPVSCVRAATSAETDSLGSSAVLDEQKYIFKFILGWQQNPGPARDRVLTRPRLPMATQARLSARSRGGPTPPPRVSSSVPRSAGHSPPETPEAVLSRRTTGEGAASLTASVEEWLRNTPTSNAAFDKTEDGRGSVAVGAPGGAGARESHVQAEWQVAEGSAGGEGSFEQLTRPMKPNELYAKNAVYGGRALAEWSQVVTECNIFTERRKDDGVERLCDVEVPSLGVDGFRKAGV